MRSSAAGSIIHWVNIGSKLKRCRKELVNEVGRSAAEDFKRKASSIINATKHHKFGHIVIFASPF